MKLARIRFRADAPRSMLVLTRRIWTAALILFVVVLVGATGYWYIGAGRWSWAECAYMTLITISTVGFGETLDNMHALPQARIWTVLLLLSGSGTLLYFASTITAFIIEGDLGGVLRRNAMQTRIDQLSGHFILCGAGRTGTNVIRELLATHTPFVVVDLDEDQIRRVAEEVDHEFLHVVGNSEDDDVLELAGIDRAAGLMAALPTDPQNMFVTLTARALNPDLRIVAKAVDPSSPPKLIQAGADSVVSTTHIGAMRLASEAIRPQVVEFLDQMLRSSTSELRVSQLHVPEGSRAVGRKLQDTGMAKARDLLVMALRKPDGTYVHIPPPDAVVEAGTYLIVLAEASAVSKWQAALRR